MHSSIVVTVPVHVFDWLTNTVMVHFKQNMKISVPWRIATFVYIAIKGLQRNVRWEQRRPMGL